jgi:hypothetical protein
VRGPAARLALAGTDERRAARWAVMRHRQQRWQCSSLHSSSTVVQLMPPHCLLACCDPQATTAAASSCASPPRASAARTSWLPGWASPCPRATWCWSAR